MFKFNCSLGNPYFWRCMLEHTKRQDHKWKFLQHALSRYVYNRSLFDIFTHNSIANIFDAILDVVSLRDESSISTCPIYVNSSSRYETLGLVTTYHITCSKHTGRPEAYCFFKNRSKPAIQQLGCKAQVCIVPKKLKYCILPTYQSSGLWRKIHSSPVQYLVCRTLIECGCHHGFVLTKKAINEKSR